MERAFGVVDAVSGRREACDVGRGKMEKGDLGDRGASPYAAKRQPVIWAWNPSA